MFLGNVLFTCFFLLLMFIAAARIAKLLFTLRNRSILNWLLLGAVYYFSVCAIAPALEVSDFFERNLGMLCSDPLTVPLG